VVLHGVREQLANPVGGGLMSADRCRVATGMRQLAWLCNLSVLGKLPVMGKLSVLGSACQYQQLVVARLAHHAPSSRGNP
jgi:hypothetical protein